MTLRGRFLGIDDTAVVKPRLNALRGMAELPIFSLFLTLASSFATAIWVAKHRKDRCVFIRIMFN